MDIKTQWTTSLTRGFVLRQEELRRLHSLALQQLNLGKTDEEECSIRYAAKFRNGTISYFNSIDEIVDLENWGERSITDISISYRLSAQADTDHTSDSIGYFDDALNQKENALTRRIDISFGTSYFYRGVYDFFSLDESISIRIDGKERNWVFITKSVLDERAKKISHSPLVSWVHFRSSLVSIAFFCVMLAFLPLTLVLTEEKITTARQLQSVQHTILKQVHTDWVHGKIKDPVDALLRAQIAAHTPPDTSAVWPRTKASSWLFVFFFLMLAIFPLTIALRFFFPKHNFVWGEYAKTYERRLYIGRFLLVGIALTIVLGVISNALSRHLGV